VYNISPRLSATTADAANTTATIATIATNAIASLYTVRCALQDIEATQVLELTAEDLQPDSVTLLKFVKFQRVSSLSIFVEENNGAETTALSSIKFFGAPVATTKMGDFKKQEHSH
jgi:PITH domain